MAEDYHIPAMLSEVLSFLSLGQGGLYLDCTLGGAGYTAAIAEALGKNGRVLALDADGLAISYAGQLLEKQNLQNVTIKQANFRHLGAQAEDWLGGPSRGQFAGVVFDLGLSSAQLNDRQRGISFQVGGPLKMLFGPADDSSAWEADEIVNSYSAAELERIFRDYGDERYARRIAAAIVERRSQKSFSETTDLVETIAQAVPATYRRERIHFATRVFQALRIAVNDELGALREALPQALELLRPGGRLVLVSYHSLEDAIVKSFFREQSRTCVCSPEAMICTCDTEPKLQILTKKPIPPTAEEVSANPRARSAKLRAAEKK